MGHLAQAIILVLWYCIAISHFVLENTCTRLSRTVDRLFSQLTLGYLAAIWHWWD